MVLTANHNETVLKEDPRARLGKYINHNETVVADPDRVPAGSRVRPLVRRTAVMLAVAALVAGLLGFGSSPGVAFGTDGVGGSPGGVVLAAGGCSSGTHVPDVDLA
jgi:hypothetical protein